VWTGRKGETGRLRTLCDDRFHLRTWICLEEEQEEVEVEEEEEEEEDKRRGGRGWRRKC
jgi:hypothetical protein